MNISIFILFNAANKVFGLPTGLLESICYVESNHKVSAIHLNDGKGHSYGICQVKYSTAKWLGYKGTEQDLMKPETNIFYAGKLLKRQILRYDGNIEKAIVAYNRGNSKDLNQSRYSQKVIKQWRNAFYVKR